MLLLLLAVYYLTMLLAVNYLTMLLAVYYFERGEYDKATSLYMRTNPNTEIVAPSPFQSIPG